jgi:predicted ArsR family transcriptional regulator
VEGEAVLPAFSSSKREILLILKREGEADLTGLSERLAVSKTAVHRHVKALEAQGLVERRAIREGIGRPRVAFRLAPESAAVFPRAYASLTCSALAFIEEKLGRTAVETTLRRRQMDVLDAYRERIGEVPFDERVAALTRLRDEEGYMAEAKRVPGGGHELLEYNCPILAVAEAYAEACSVERELFERVLDAEVETTHRVVAGNHVCRFLIRPRTEARGGSPVPTGALAAVLGRDGRTGPGAADVPPRETETGASEDGGG